MKYLSGLKKSKELKKRNKNSKILEFLKNLDNEYYTWIRQNGQLFTHVDKEESKRISKQVKSKEKLCYYNSWKAFDYHKPEMKYFEGFVYGKIAPFIKHAWLVKKGKVIDPTFALFDDYGIEYFGIEIPLDTLNKLAKEENEITSFLPKIFDKARNNSGQK